MTAQAVPSTIAATTSAGPWECTLAASTAAAVYTRHDPPSSRFGATARGWRSSSARAIAVGIAAAAHNAP